MTIIDKEALITAIKNSNTIKELLKKFKCCVPTIKENIKLYGLEYPKYKHGASCDDDFFARKDEFAMYWAGFLAADGCLRSNKNAIKLELATADRQHIERFKEHTKSAAIIHDVIRKPSKLIVDSGGTKDKYYSSYFVISSKKMYNDLREYNIVPKKTYIYEMPEWLIKHKLVNHFIRGYIDGDGSFGFNKRNNKNVSIRLQLTGASKVVEQIYNVLKFNCNTRYGNYSEYNSKNKKFWFNSLSDLDKIINFLYKDATVFLERKFKTAKEIKTILEKSVLYNFDPKILQALYNKLGSFVEVAKEFNCHPTTIRDAMHNFGLSYKVNKKRTNATKNIRRSQEDIS
jgi:hypothetical protein